MCIVYTVVDGGHVFGTWSFMSLGLRGEDGRLGPFSLRMKRQSLSFTTLIMNQLRLRESWSLRVLETTQQDDARTDDLHHRDRLDPKPSLEHQGTREVCL